MNALTPTGAPLSGASAPIPRDMRDGMALAELAPWPGPGGEP